MQRWERKACLGGTVEQVESARAVLKVGGHQLQLHLGRGLIVQIKEFEHHLEDVKGPLKAVSWGLTLWERSPELGWRHEFLAIGLW